MPRVAKFRLSFALLVLCGIATSTYAEASQPIETDVFIAGEDGYHTYRIPAMVQAADGTLLAFCEGRKNSRSDAGDIDLLLRTSNDGGNTWSPTRIIWDDNGHTCGNPCPVVDQATGTVWLLLTWNSGSVHEKQIQAGYGENSRRVFVSHSQDNGQSWAAPKEITRQAKDERWSWYATGPGAGIQIQRGDHTGRLVIPCDHKVPKAGGADYFSHIIYSDDHGTTWHLGGTSPRDDVNECEVVELADGRLLLNMRNYDTRVRSRQICFSEDGGITWGDQRHDETLLEPICQASVRRYRWPVDGAPGVILFSNPASTQKRERMTIRVSLDEGITWPSSRALYEGGSAYSCLCVMHDESIGCLYEKDGYKRITFARFGIDWVQGDATSN